MNPFLKRILRLVKQFNIVIIGLNGANSSGKELKGTALHELCLEALPKSLRMCRIVISKEITWHIDSKTHLAEPLIRAQPLMDDGELAPNGPIFELLWIALDREVRAGHRVILLDGFPREPRQGKPLIKAKWFFMIYLKTTLKTTLARAKGRREDAIANGRKPRRDDRPTRAKWRYSKVFLKQTLPVIKALKAARPDSVETIKATDPVTAQVTLMAAAVARSTDPQRIHWAAWDMIMARIFDRDHPVGNRLMKIDDMLPKDARVASKPDRSRCFTPTPEACPAA